MVKGVGTCVLYKSSRYDIDLDIVALLQGSGGG